MFFFWVIGQFSNRAALKSINKYALWLSLPGWIILAQVSESISTEEMEVDLFPMVYRVINSFLASSALLELVEEGQSDLFNKFRFWILVAILFYTFTTFFITLIGLKFGKEVWYLHNILNITTYILYSIGFYCCKRSHLDSDEALMI